MEPDLQRILHELRESVAEALAESPAVGERLEALRRHGFSVQLSVDCRRGEEDSEAERPAATDGRVPEGRQEFRMTSGDLGFLRSLGIDPTRSTRGLRRVRHGEDPGSEN